MSVLGFLAAHKAVVSLWALREAHLAWPYLRPGASLPFLRGNGGISGIWRTVRNGWNPAAQSTQQKENQGEKV